MEFCSKKSTAGFSPHAKFSTRRECPRFHGEPVEILFQKVNCGFFAARKVFRQKRVPKIPWGACGILFQKINCGFFAARKVFRQKRVPKIPWRACGNFVPKNQLRLFRRTQSFPPEESAQDSMESMLKSNQTAAPHAHSMARMHLLSTAEINASLFPSIISVLLFC